MKALFIAALCSAGWLGGITAHAQPTTLPQPRSPNPAAPMTNLQTSEKNKAVVRKLYEDILNPGQLALLGQVVADDYTGVQGEHGPAGLAATISPLRAAFPDIKWTVEDIIAEGSQVVVRWSWAGTQQGAFRGFSATHQPVTNSAIAIYQLRDYKIVRAWMQSDRLGFLQQIGAIPPDIAARLQPAPAAQR
jgi:steroid delta-isomerase-like uncharacterized protein